MLQRGLAHILLAACVPVLAVRGEDVYPDFDLQVPCPARVSGTPGGTVRFPARVVLRTAPGGTDGQRGARAWSLSLAPSQGARIVEATTAGTDGAPRPEGQRDDGYESTELTSGEGNEGAVSVVILSYSKDMYLPGSGSAVLLDLVIESMVPASGCTEASVEFVDGRQGSGQPVRNILTYGVNSAATRRDDGGASDNDTDGYEPCRFSACAGPFFVRGDATGDMDVDLSDAVKVLDHLFRAGPPPICLRTSDVDADGQVNVSDAIYLMNHLFLGGKPPEPPYPDCGLVTGPSTVQCDAAQQCP